MKTARVLKTKESVGHHHHHLVLLSFVKK